MTSYAFSATRLSSKQATACTKSRGASAISRSVTQLCTSPWRLSSGIESRFSSRSYTIWLSHAVSSMVMKLSISATLFIGGRSLDDDIGFARHALPFLVIGAHVGDELRPAHVHHVHAHAAIALAHRFDGKCLAQGRAQFIDDDLRDASRDENPRERARFVALDPCLIERGHVGQQRRALERGDGQGF